MADTFSGHSSGLDSPASDFEAVVTNTDFTATCRGVYVGGAGNVSAKSVSGSDVVFTGVPAGSILPIRATRINTTNTTATDMVAMW